MYRTASPLFPMTRTLEIAFDKQQINLATAHGQLANINLSTILTILIQDTGRFAEHYASDLFISWEGILPYTQKPTDELLERAKNLTQISRGIKVFGIRESGVDGLEFFMNRLADTISYPYDYVHAMKVYRRVLALEITWLPDMGSTSVSCVLKDITHTLNRMDPDDIETYKR